MNLIQIRSRGWPDGDDVTARKEDARKKLLASIPVQIPHREKRKKRQHLPTGKPGACAVCLQWLPLTKHHVKPVAVTGKRNTHVERVCVECHGLIHRTFPHAHLMTAKWTEIRAAIRRLRDL